VSVGVGIIGCGLIGQKRAAALGPDGHLVIAADPLADRAEKLASAHAGATASTEWRDVLDRDDVEIVMISATNEVLAPISIAAVTAGRHVLVEKPGARSAIEAATVRAAARRAGRFVRVGFNHRYHPALQKARELVDAGALGALMFIRGRYGHGGRLGYDREWRADPLRSGGGELIDQGVHLIDLSRWFLGEFAKVEGFAHTFYWQMPVDDNAFLLLRTAEDRTAFLHVSCTEWKNLFSLEIYGRLGKIQIDGLGGSYGIERLTHYQMLPEMGPPDTTAWEYPRGDQSWRQEFLDFLTDIRLARAPSPGIEDAEAALTIVDEIHHRSGYLFEPRTAGSRR
jgi:predicted dehydrogenase